MPREQVGGKEKRGAATNAETKDEKEDDDGDELSENAFAAVNDKKNDWLDREQDGLYARRQAGAAK
jgi:hypothetical protein